MGLKLATLGPEGSFSEIAAKRMFENAEIIFSEDLEEIFFMVEGKEVSYGAIPVENSLEGSVNLALDLLLERDVKICKEVILNIEHCLLALPGVKIEDINLVMSHPHALAQCRKFIKKLGVKTKSCASTSEAAKEIMEKNLKNVAAIAPEVAAEVYNLEILKKEVQDRASQTRFIAIAKKDAEFSGKDKTSIIFGLRDKPGALWRVLGIFAREKINLTKIESRPSKKSLGDYIFYVDFEGHRKENEIKKVLEDMKKETTFIKILGSYPKS